jgi:hypothetical protein
MTETGIRPGATETGIETWDDRNRNHARDDRDRHLAHDCDEGGRYAIGTGDQDRTIGDWGWRHVEIDTTSPARGARAKAMK